MDDEAPFCSNAPCPSGLIGAGVVAQLAKNAVLKNINLEKNCVNQEGATALAQGLAKNTGVRVIDLMNQKNCRCLQLCHVLALALSVSTSRRQIFSQLIRAAQHPGHKPTYSMCIFADGATSVSTHFWTCSKPTLLFSRSTGGLSLERASLSTR
jgi:hypothetical protein